MDLSHSPAFVGKREYREARKRQDVRVQSESGGQNIPKVNAAAEEESVLSGISKIKKGGSCVLALIFVTLMICRSVSCLTE